MFKILYLYLFGYVNIEVEGFFIERFINMCILNKIFLWRMSRKSKTQLKAKISVGDFRYLREIGKKTKCRISIKSKKGMPFLLHRYKKRKIFAITLAVIAIFLFGLTRFIWNIEINCDGEINEDEIYEILEEQGIYKGALIYNINTDEIVNQIRLERNDISWVGIKIDGTNVVVNIVLATEKPELKY